MSKSIDLAAQRKAAMAIAAKYDHSHSKLQNNATAKELKPVLMYVANEDNHKQRVVVGLDKVDSELKQTVKAGTFKTNML